MQYEVKGYNGKRYKMIFALDTFESKVPKVHETYVSNYIVGC